MLRGREFHRLEASVGEGCFSGTSIVEGDGKVERMVVAGVSWERGG